MPIPRVRTPRGSRDPVVIALVALTALAAALRLATLGRQSYWLDEAVTVDLVRRSFGGMLSGIPVSESTPPLYYVVAWAWAKLFGTHAAALRLLSALAGIAFVPVCHVAATRLVSRRAGLAAAAIAATNPLLVWYSQEARSYALLVLLCGLSLAAFASARRSRGSAWLWALWSALALATHYFAVFLVAPEALWLALPALRRRERPVPAACAAVALVGFALLPLAIRQSSNHSARYIAQSGLARRIVQVPKQDLVGFAFPHQTLVAAVALALAAAGLALLARADAPVRAGAATAALLGAAAAGLPLLLAVAGVDYFITRNVLPSWLPLAVVVAAGLGAVGARRAGPAIAALLCALGIAVVALVDTHPAYQRDDWRGVAHALGAPRVARALVVQPLNGRFPLQLYRPRVRTLPASAAVREIDVVAVVRRGRGRPRPPRPPTPPAPAGFALVERRYAATYTLIRWRAPGVTPVGAAVPLAGLLIEPGGADYLYESP